MSSDKSKAQQMGTAAVPEWEQPDMPTVSIYQNPEHIEGILQQLFERPVFTDHSTEERREQQDTVERQMRVKGKGAGELGVPRIARLNVDVDVEPNESKENRRSAGGTTLTRGKYTQPYYLHVVRGTLRTRKLIKPCSTLKAASRLRPGDFVEFTARFTPNQANALLDIATPELVEAIVRKRVHASGMKDFIPGPPETIQKFSLELEAKQASWAAIARALTEAVMADFRIARTREFYAHLGTDEEPLTFITMCEPSHFVAEDEDRILDGAYTVLAKVVGPLETDEPVFRRNKVLERIHPEAVDFAAEQLNESLEGAIAKVNSMRGDEAVETAGDRDGIFDFRVDSRVTGASLRVIPVAIFV